MRLNELGTTCKAFIYFILFFKDFVYLFMRDPEREAETQAEGEAGSLREAGLDPGPRGQALG